jgi:hypothetical protein
MIPRIRTRQDTAVPWLLVAFFASTLIMVLGLALLLRGGHDWVDFAAIALVLALGALVLGLIGRQLADDEPAGDHADGSRP